MIKGREEKMDRGWKNWLRISGICLVANRAHVAASI